MSEQIVIAIITVAGTMIAALGGILVSNRLTNHRIEQLEKKVEKHNNLVERVAVVENSVKGVQSRLSEISWK